MKKNIFFKLIFLSFILLFGIFLNCCSMYTINRLYPYPSEAVDPPGLIINPENFAYLGGSIRAIDNYDFDPGKRAIGNYPKRALRVPAEENIKALVYYSSSIGSYRTGSLQVNIIQHGFKFVSLPPLENGCFYILYIKPEKYSDIEDKNIILMRRNPKTWKFENVHGAAFIENTIF